MRRISGNQKMEKKDLKIVFFGTPEFAVASLDRLVEEGYDVEAVVTMPDKTAGRGHRLIQSDVKKYAEAHGLEVLQPDKLRAENFLTRLSEIDADLFIVIAFRMLPEAVWAMPRLGTFNLHASVLPAYRGAAPINRAIMNGETETGITTFFLNHEIDKGDIIDVRKTEISPEDNAGTLHDRLMTMGADMVAETVGKICDGTLTTRPQPAGEFVPAPKIFREDCAIKWDSPTAEIHHHIRGLSPYPAAFSTLKDEAGRTFDVKILTSAVSDDAPGGLAPGETEVRGRRLFAGTSDGAIEILELQPSGKKRMDASSFLLGYHPARFLM